MGISFYLEVVLVVVFLAGQERSDLFRFEFINRQDTLSNV